MHMSKKFEVLTISDDFMFGIIMRNPKYCKPFWETILNIKISRIEYPQDQKTINLSLDAKSIRLDVYVEDDSNTVYNIEHTVKTEFCNLCLYLYPFHIGRHVYTVENRCLEDTNLLLNDATQKIILNTKGIFDDVLSFCIHNIFHKQNTYKCPDGCHVACFKRLHMKTTSSSS